MAFYECMICGSREHVLREGKILLCTRCIEALGDALAEKLWSASPDEQQTDCPTTAQKPSAGGE